MKDIALYEVKDGYVKLTEFGEDDYSVWFTDDIKDDTAGASMRGTKEDVYEEIIDTYPELKKQIQKDLGYKNKKNIQKVKVFMYNGLVDKIIDIETGKEIEFEEVESSKEESYKDKIKSLKERVK